jgi:hemoglobin-like flavoprotein
MRPDDLLRIQTQAESLFADDTFAAAFYDRLFDAHPETAALFPTDLTAQRARFVHEFSVLVAALRDLEAFERRARPLGRRHRDYGVRVEHYGFVRDALVATIADRIGAAFTTDDRAAWTRAYNLVAELMQEGGRASGTSPE